MRCWTQTRARRICSVEQRYTPDVCWTHVIHSHLIKKNNNWTYVLQQIKSFITLFKLQPTLHKQASISPRVCFHFTPNLTPPPSSNYHSPHNRLSRCHWRLTSMIDVAFTPSLALPILDRAPTAPPLSSPSINVNDRHCQLPLLIDAAGWR